MTETPDFAAENLRFWEQRGHANIAGDEIALMAEHARYVRYVNERDQSALRRLLQRKPSRVLDAGCGSGRLAAFLALGTREVVALDASASLLDRARSAAANAGLSNVQFVQAPVGTSLDVGQFDLAVLSGVLNYLTDEDAATALERTAERLNPGGRLYLRNTCGVRGRVYRGGTADNAPTIHRTAAEYRAMVEAVPTLRVLEQRYLFPPLCLPNMLYYHGLPKRLRDQRVAAAALDAWFALEDATADLRLRLFGPLYRPLVRAIRKQTAFEVLIAEKRARPGR